MAVVMFSLCFLMWFAFYLRHRYIANSTLSFALQRPLLPRVILSVAVLFVFYVYIHHVLYDSMDNFFLECSFFILICLSLFISNPLAFFMVKGPISNTYLNHDLRGWLRIDINRKFIPPDASKSELVSFVSTFTKDILNQEGVRWQKIIIKSHLITPQFRRVMKDILKGCEAISFECEEYTLSFAEIIKLNLLYGGNTRFQVLSLKRHENGFKVHKKGSIFRIQRTKRC